MFSYFLRKFNEMVVEQDEIAQHEQEDGWLEVAFLTCAILSLVQQKN